MNNKKGKIMIDMVMFLGIILIINLNLTGIFFHEVLGIVLFILFLLHIILNFKWIKQITKNIRKVSTKTKLMYAIDILTFIVYFITIGLGISISAKLFHFNLYSFTSLLFHHIVGRLARMITFIHLGLHLNLLISKVTKNKMQQTFIYIIYIILAVLFSIYLVYTLLNSYIWQGMM